VTTSPLALLGGTPTITDPGPHFTWPPITDTDRQAVAKQLDTAVSIPDRSGVVAELEDALAAYLGVAHVVSCCTGTAALHSMFAAACIGAGDEVIVPAYTFHATASPLFHLGARPVLAEVDPVHGLLDPADVEARISPRTKALIAVHLWGVPAPMGALADIAARHGLALLEDASHAHGATWHTRRVGSLGTAAAFSLNGPKPLSAGEGGFVATDDDEIYYRLLAHGQYNKRCRAEIPREHALADYAVTGMGLKLRIHPFAAALALSQLPRLDSYLAGRERISIRMREKMARVPGIDMPEPPEATTSAWYAMPLRYRPEAFGGLPIQRFLAALRAEGAIEADRPGSTCPLSTHRLFQHPAGLLSGYADYHGYTDGDFPVARSLHAATLKLPVWHRRTEVGLVDAYARAITKVAAHHEDLISS
jgi:perosamine synthetase